MYLALGNWLELFLKCTLVGMTYLYFLIALHFPTLPSAMRGRAQWTKLLSQLKCLNLTLSIVRLDCLLPSWCISAPQPVGCHLVLLVSGSKSSHTLFSMLTLFTINLLACLQCL